MSLNALPKTAQLRVSNTHHHLEYIDGKPFFYLGDTAWGLFHCLTLEEATFYLENRARKGFTVIQAVLLGGLGGQDAPIHGIVPLDGNDPTRPNESYFRHVDAIVERAAQLRLFVGLLPTWGSHWELNQEGRTGIFTPETALIYGRFLGERYRDAPAIWILGGDQNATDQRERAVIEALADGLRQGDQGQHLITYHPRGPGQSSDIWHNAAWLDFNMSQSSHGAQDHDNGLFAEHDYGLTPPKPTLDGEPRYEMLPVGFYNADTVYLRRFDDTDVRQAAYWSVLAGACGHTYGHNSVFQMWQPGRPAGLGACVPWSEALDHPGAFQMGHLRRLFESRPFHKLVPAQSLILDGPRTGGAKVRSACAEDGSFAFFYSPRGEPFTVYQGLIPREQMPFIRRMEAIRQVRASWFDPRYGVETPLHTTTTPGIQTFAPPTCGRGCDWLLVLEAMS